MIKDRTEDEGMPLRNHEQVLLLNDQDHEENQVTHITHHTQTSALL